MKTALLTILLSIAISGYSQREPFNKVNVHGDASSNGGNPADEASANLAAAPVYPGGNKVFLNFIGKNINYPAMARANKTQGQVLVRFLVDTDGNVKKAYVPKGMGIGHGCDEEAIRVVMSSPKWQPGMRLGSPASMWYEVPIVFALTELK